MTYYLADRTAETSTSTGTGDLVLDGAIPGYRTFSTFFGSDGDTFPYVIEEVDGSGVPNGAWEIGIGTYIVGTNSISRLHMWDCSDPAGDPINFSGDLKVFCGLNGWALEGVPTPVVNFAPDLTIDIASSNETTAVVDVSGWTYLLSAWTGSGQRAVMKLTDISALEASTVGFAIVAEINNYVLDAAMLNQGHGIVMRESATGKIVIFSIAAVVGGAQQITVDAFETDGSGTKTNIFSYEFVGTPPNNFIIQHDATNIGMLAKFPAGDQVTLFVDTLASYFTVKPDQLGVGFWGDNSGTTSLPNVGVLNIKSFTYEPDTWHS